MKLSIRGGNIEAIKSYKSVFKSHRTGTRPYLEVESIKKGDESLNAAAPEARRPAAVIEERILRIFKPMAVWRRSEQCLRFGDGGGRKAL